MVALASATAVTFIITRDAAAARDYSKVAWWNDPDCNILSLTQG